MKLLTLAFASFLLFSQQSHSSEHNDMRKSKAASPCLMVCLLGCSLVACEQLNQVINPYQNQVAAHANAYGLAKSVSYIQMCHPSELRQALPDSINQTWVNIKPIDIKKS
ncbi:MAG: hypothetical protein P4L31_07805 [Candidatus Babeliales bacterium]|nr:hypothetical protein [Candidatus Babeliales bacterium]